MPKQQTDQLVLLIQSLTKAEKRHFKLYAGRNASSSDALFIKLFEVIDKQKRYDETNVIKRVPGIKKSQLHNLRSKLYKEVLVSLRLLQRSQKIEKQAFHQFSLSDGSQYRQPRRGPGNHNHAHTWWPWIPGHRGMKEDPGN